MSKSCSRLPVTIKPYHYDITIKPNLKDFIFTGSETINLDVKESTNIIILNARKLDISKATISDVPATTIEISKPDETVKFVFPNPLPIGKTNELKLEFQGTMDDDLKGLYRTGYTGSNGERKYILVTQFESSDARSCFPCWDEPSFKSTFDLSLTIPLGLTGLSNMPIKSQNTSDNLKTINFETTVTMSTYLIALAIGELDYIESMHKETRLRVYTLKGQSRQGEFALEVKKQALPFYESYFRVDYPLPKLDSIAVKDLSFGAMENWGLMTFQDSDILVEASTSSSMNKQRIALMVSHEIAHQWFGNLVTMEWWSHLWLNEGYASFMEYLCVDHVFPHYKIWNQFVTDVQSNALKLDALKNSHPIEVEINHHSEIPEVFDSISYNKGASVIRMLHAFIGDECFRRGMNIYLKNHAYGNAETNDLWKALEKASEKPIERIMSTWTRQQGFPLVYVDEERRGDSRILKFNQKQFNDANSKRIWCIPITVASEADPGRIIFNGIMDEENLQIVLDGILDTHWVKINFNTVGFFRTRYEDAMLQSLLVGIGNSSLPLLDKLGIYDDYFAFVQAGILPTVELFRLMEVYKAEDNYVVWSALSNSIVSIRLLLSNTNLEEKFNRFVTDLFEGVYKKFPHWDPIEDHSESLLRVLVLDNLVEVGYKPVIEESRIKFREHCEARVSLEPDIRQVVYKAVLTDGDSKIYDQMMTFYRTEQSNEERERILKALGTIEDDNLLEKFLIFIMSDQVTAAGTLRALSSITFRSFKGRSTAWEFIKKNWTAVRRKYPSGLVLPRLVGLSIKNFLGKEFARDVVDFFESNPTPGVERTVRRGVEEIHLRTDWLERDRKSIEEFFSMY